MPSLKGWVILHPAKTKKQVIAEGMPARFAKPSSAYVEVIDFHVKRWKSRKIPGHVTREKWRSKFRPDCQIVRATLTW